MKQKIYNSLVIFNAVILLLIILVAITGFILIKDHPKVQKLINAKIASVPMKEISQSRFVSNLRKMGQTEEAYTPPAYDLKIDPQDLRDMQLLIQDMAKEGHMTEENQKWYPARFYAEGKEYKVNVRLRGDAPVHWINPKKSWRIKFKKNNLFKGYRNLNFVIPHDVAYTNPQIAYDVARKAGLLAPDGGFALLRINGVDMGLYYWWEQNSSEMLEKLQYPEGEIFRFDNLHLHGFGYVKNMNDYVTHASSYAPTIRKEGDTALGYMAQRWDEFLQLINEAPDDIFTDKISHFVDMEKALKLNALTWMFGNYHLRMGDNMRWYYDNTTGLLEPIIYDVARAYPVPKAHKGTFEFNEEDPFLMRVLTSAQFRHQRNQSLWEFINNPELNFASRSDELGKKLEPYLYRGVNPRAWEIEQFHKDGLVAFKQNKEILRHYLDYSKVMITPRLKVINDKPYLELELIPDGISDVLIQSMTINFKDAVDLDVSELGISLKDNSGQKNVSFSDSVNEKVLNINFKDDALRLAIPVNENLIPQNKKRTLLIEFPERWRKAWTEPGFVGQIHWNIVNTISQRQLGDDDIFQFPHVYDFDKKTSSIPALSVEDFIAKSTIPFQVIDSQLVLEKGIYELNEDLVIPRSHGLHLKAGAVLKLGPRVSILTYQPLTISGAKGNLVIIAPINEESPWGSLVVSRAKKLSTVNYLNISRGSEDWINGIYASGQLCFYSSDVEINNSKITSAQADDALNIKKASFSINNTEFLNNSFDAFDGDWVQGTIENSQFKNNGGDGLDTSGADVIVRDSFFSGMGDKAISAGEKSRVTAINNVIRNSEMGVASKDFSKVNIYSSVFYKNKTALALYRKKQVFGGAEAMIVSSLLWANEEDFAVDEESKLTLIGVGVEQFNEQANITAEDLRIGDISSLYAFEGENEILTKDEINGSPFARGPKLEEQVLNEYSLPDLSNYPIGLLEKK